MSANPIETIYSEEEYLTLEREAEHKSEFISGHIVAMTGASRRHNQLNTNVVGQLYQQLKDTPCSVYASDMRVKVAESRTYNYPDVVITCAEPQFEDTYLDTLTNPLVIIEILSPSTEAYDRGDKFASYRQLTFLQEYVLISQDKSRVEQFTRQDGGLWLLTETSRIGDVVRLA